MQAMATNHITKNRIKNSLVTVNSHSPVCATTNK